ncbi:unnamed protein product, partial [Didymodactylos carnosus]
MGNKNDKKRNSITDKMPVRELPTSSSYKWQIIDLDDVVESWVWTMMEATKTRQTSQYKREELIININWKRVQFTQSEAEFHGAPPIKLPKSQTLFKTTFANKTETDQVYSFKTQRRTISTFCFTFNQGFCKSQEGAVVFRLPEQIVEVGGGIKREQRIEYGQDKTNEQEMLWCVDNVVKVPPRTKAFAELYINEEQYNGDFSVEVRFSGRITATISTRTNPNNYIKYMEGDIVNIVRDYIQGQNSNRGFEIVDNWQVKYIMRGKVQFRYG